MRFEKDVIGTGSPEQREEVFKALPGMEEFWNDQRLRASMEKTSAAQEIGPEFPDPPPGPVVSSLLKAISVVGRRTGFTE